MTKREQHLVLLVGLVICGWLVFHFWPRASNSSPENGSVLHENVYRLNEANRLLRSQENIITRSKVVATELRALKKRFYSADNPENASIGLLKAVEEIAAKAHLLIQQKNLVRLKDDETIGVALEGKTGSESLIRFLQLTSRAAIGLRINRLQIHSLPDTRQLNYQVTVISLMVK